MRNGGSFVSSRRDFIARETALMPVPHVPELRLHLAHEAIALWQRTEEELAEMGLPPPFWAFAWAGGQALARYVLDHPAMVAGRHVLDFASGSGLVGIAAAKAGAASVLCADLDEFALEAIALNAEANGVSVDVAGEDQLGRAGAWDVILAGDICYEQALAARVIAWLAAEQARGVSVLIGDPGRAYLPKDRLVSLATYEVQTVGALEDNEIKRTCVWRLA
ncbi:MAG: nicotinamide N-methylase [Methylobacterium sp.]|nr:MAG: nicotinamide N-methylase [Methylobacterium sp.]